MTTRRNPTRLDWNQRKKARSRRRLVRQILEPRHLLAVDVSFQDGVLEIATDEHEDIIVTAGDGFMKINGVDPERGCIVASKVREIHVDGGILSRVDLSAVHKNPELFAELNHTTGSLPDPQWLRDVAGIDPAELDKLHATLYAEEHSRQTGISWSAKADYIDDWIREHGATAKQLDWIRDNDFFPAEQMKFYDSLAPGHSLAGSKSLAAESPSIESNRGNVQPAVPELPLGNLVAEGEPAGGFVHIVPMDGSTSPPFTETSIGEFEGGLTVYMKAPSPSAGINGFTVDYATSPMTATPGEDYTEVTGQRTWQDGDEGEMRRVWIPVEDDMIDEYNDEFKFEMTNITNMDGDEGDTALGNKELEIEIVDTTPEPYATITSDQTVSEAAGSVNFTVTLSHESDKDVRVRWATDQLTATADVDYVHVDDTTGGNELVFAPRQTEMTGMAQLIDDSLDELTEKFEIELAGGTNVLASGGWIEVTIADDDPPPNVFVDDVVIQENSTEPAKVRIWMDAESALTVTVPYFTSNGEAVKLFDYGEKTGAFTFNPGDTFDYVYINIVDDNLAENDERFYVNLGTLTNANPGSTPGTVTIISDDPDPFVNIDSVTVTEGDPGDDVTATFTVSLSGPSGRPMSVTATTIDGTAVAGDDYQSTTSSFSWPLNSSGQFTSSTPRQFTVPITEDLIPEETEEFYAQLVGAVNVIPGLSIGTGTIEDDDPEVDLDTYLINHNQTNGELPDEDEETLGAYLPVNNDDDDYDPQNLPDKDQSGPIDRESDLLPIILRPASKHVPGATYNLEIPGHVLVWKNDDRTVEFKQNSPFSIDANSPTTLYVEGISEGSGLIKIHWTEPGVATRLDLDRIKVTTFTWNGPLNVPGYSRHTYEASGGHSSAAWIGAENSDEFTAVTVPGPAADRAEVLWNQGAVVGKPSFQARDGYVWDLEVNVVEVLIAPSTGTEVVVNNNAVQSDPTNNPTLLLANFGVFDAVNAKIDVQKVEGPSVNGSRRGEKFIEMGFINQVRVEQKNGVFQGTTPAQVRTSSLEDGQIHWDATVPNTYHWYSQTPKRYLDVTSDSWNLSAPNPLLEFEFTDNPELLASDLYVWQGDQVDLLNLDLNFWTYFAVRAKGPNVNGSADQLTIRASFQWQTNSSGTVDANGDFSPDSISFNSQTGYNIETNGSTVPDAAPNINQILNQSETWSW